ncbi:MAG: hypothetical protein GX418_04460 [Clostridiales bacterium]|nr:hypothetical protein [Clostridiales bacterium]
MSVWLDGVALESIDPAIRLKGVLIGAVETTEITSQYAKYGGLRYLGQTENSRKVKITFKGLDSDPARREQALCGVLDWARGTRLELLQRPEQYLTVRCTGGPSLELVRDYAAKDITVQFTAFDPDFKAKYPTVATLSAAAGAAATATLTPPGTQDITFLEAEVRNDGETAMNALTLSVGGRSFAYTGLGLAAGKTLLIARDGDGRLTMTADGVSVLDKRTPESDDDLILLQRQMNTVTVLAERACAVKLLARGQYR